MENLLSPTGFACFCLYNCGNPANRLGADFTVGEPNFWALRLFVNMANNSQESHFYCNKALESWALIETLNTGSYQRVTLPEPITKALLGSGRWHANDNGGHYGLLRQAILDWIRLGNGQEIWHTIAYKIQRPKQEWDTELQRQAAERAERKLWAEPDWQSNDGLIKAKGGRLLISGQAYEIGQTIKAEDLSSNAGFLGSTIQDILTDPTKWQSEWQGPGFEITRPCPATENRVYQPVCDGCPHDNEGKCPWVSDVPFDDGPFVFLWNR